MMDISILMAILGSWFTKRKGYERKSTTPSIKITPGLTSKDIREATERSRRTVTAYKDGLQISPTTKVLPRNITVTKTRSGSLSSGTGGSGSILFNKKWSLQR